LIESHRAPRDAFDEPLEIKVDASYNQRVERNDTTEKDERLVYPRPALGLRPWFALERRALSLRRFAFAIVWQGYQAT
jgi:hypothetical protein